MIGKKPERKLRRWPKKRKKQKKGFYQECNCHVMQKTLFVKIEGDIEEDEDFYPDDY